MIRHPAWQYRMLKQVALHHQLCKAKMASRLPAGILRQGGDQRLLTNLLTAKEKRWTIVDRMIPAHACAKVKLWLLPFGQAI
jgi:hypothetical protein